MFDNKHAAFPGRLVIVGFGSIGQGVLPLLLRHIDIRPDQIAIITAEPRGHEVAAEYGVALCRDRADPRQLPRTCWTAGSAAGDFLLNLSVDVSSVALIELCQEKGALYLDTCIEPWPGGYTDPNLPPSARSNYALRESALALRRRLSGGSDRGHDPRRQSRASCRISSSRRCSTSPATPRLRRGMPGRRAPVGRGSPSGSASRSSISPSATPRSRRSPKEPGEFVNTWSIDGFFSEGSQPAELGWGTHERHFPADGAAPRFRQRGRDLSAAPRRRRRGCAAGRRSKAPITAS